MVPGTESGNPAASAALRAMFMACSPTVMVQPMTTSSTSPGSRSLRSTQGQQRLGRQVDGVPSRQPAAAAPDRGADGVDDHGAGHRGIVAEYLTVCQIRAGMDLTFSPAEQAFRAEARAWLEAHAPAPGALASLDTAEGFEQHRAWERELFEDRWSVVSWPAEYGGRDVGIFEWLIFEEEYYRAQAPRRVSQNGIFLLAPTLLEYGTAEQKARFLRPMAAGDEIWCQGWSEPDAGSDLAGIRSRAVPGAGGGWVLDGQKTWCSARRLRRLVLRHLPHRPRGRAPPRASPTSSSPWTPRA